MDNKITLRPLRSARTSRELIGVIRITPEAEIILRELQFRTGLTLCHIASQIIIQAEEFIQIAGDE